MKYILPLLSLLIHLNVKSQTRNQDDFVRDSLKIMSPKLVRPQAKFDNRQTIFRGQSLEITGFDAGVLLKDKLRITLGYYSLENDLNYFRQTIDSIDVGKNIQLH